MGLAHLVDKVLRFINKGALSAHCRLCAVPPSTVSL
jgi:hypothetical protein